MSRPGDRTKNYQPTQLDQGIAAVLVAISRRDRGRMGRARLSNPASCSRREAVDRPTVDRFSAGASYAT
jgi:hypothetical protein